MCQLDTDEKGKSGGSASSILLGSCAYLDYTQVDTGLSWLI